MYNTICVTEITTRKQKNGVWLSLARAPGLGPGGRRFESRLALFFIFRQ